MVTNTAEIKKEMLKTTLRNISVLSDEPLSKLIEYTEELIEELEDAEDIEYIKAHKDDGPNVPLSEIIKDYEADYGSLSRI